MPKKSYRQAINEALAQEMERDHRVIVMGEDVAGGLGAPGEDDAWGGPLGVTKGLMSKFGRDRVLYSLFGYDRFAANGPRFHGDKGLPDRNGMYLIGWGDGPALPVTIDGDGGRQQGHTLYIIRLNV